MKSLQYAVPPLSRKAIRQYVEMLRKKYGLEGLSCFPIAHFLEYLFPDHYQVVSKLNMGHYEGLMVTGQDIIAIREDVYDGAVAGDGRSRFTLAHEIGHFLMHRTDSHPRMVNPKNLKPYENPEWQADNFASELLMPVNLVKGLLMDEIVKQCMVTPSAASVRIDILKKEGLYQ